MTLTAVLGATMVLGAGILVRLIQGRGQFLAVRHWHPLMTGHVRHQHMKAGHAQQQQSHTTSKYHGGSIPVKKHDSHEVRSRLSMLGTDVP